MGSGLSYPLISLPFLFFPIIVYIAVFIAQYRKQELETLRMQVLSTRMALFLPVYAILIYIALVAGQAVYIVFQLPLAVFEAYSYYCFLTLLVTNFGGPKEIVQYMSQKPELICCNCCCPSESVAIYKRCIWAMFHMMFTRTIVVALQVLFYLIDYKTPSKEATALGAVCSLVATIFLLRGIISVVLIYENVYEHAKNFDGVLKILLLKVSIGVIVIQGLVEEFLVSYGNLNYDSGTGKSDQFQALQVYGFIVLVELSALGFVTYYTFSKKITTFKPTLPPLQSTAKPIIGSSDKIHSFCGFVCAVLNFNDVYSNLTYRDEAPDVSSTAAV